jgi:hypothetical protein
MKAKKCRKTQTSTNRHNTCNIQSTKYKKQILYAIAVVVLVQGATRVVRRGASFNRTVQGPEGIGNTP